MFTGFYLGQADTPAGATLQEGIHAYVMGEGGYGGSPIGEAGTQGKCCAVAVLHSSYVSTALTSSTPRELRVRAQGSTVQYLELSSLVSGMQHVTAVPPTDASSVRVGRYC